MRISPAMSLRIWNELSDPYDHEQLAGNWGKVDAHDHSPGRGVRLGATSLEEHSIAYPLLSKRPFHELYNALPGAPEDGEVIYYTPEEGVVWNLRYHEASASAHKWEFIGGGELQSSTAGNFKITTSASLSTYNALGSNEAVESPPLVTVPLNGDYEVILFCEGLEAVNGLGQQINLSLGTSAVALVARKILSKPNLSSASSNQIAMGTYLNATATQILKVYLSGNNSTAEIWKMGAVSIRLRPRRVG